MFASFSHLSCCVLSCFLSSVGTYLSNSGTQLIWAHFCTLWPFKGHRMQTNDRIDFKFTSCHRVIFTYSMWGLLGQSILLFLNTGKEKLLAHSAALLMVTEADRSFHKRLHLSYIFFGETGFAEEPSGAKNSWLIARAWESYYLVNKNK